MRAIAFPLKCAYNLIFTDEISTRILANRREILLETLPQIVLPSSQTNL